MLLPDLQTIFHRELLKLRKEIELYKQEASLWAVAGDIKNPGGNLCLHLVGNLNTYIGRELGGTGYVRNREAEFSQKDVPRELLLQKIDMVTEVVTATLSRLDAAQLEQDYPVPVFDQPMKTGFFLLHLACHLTYHLGQINYHRRLVDP